AFQRAELSLHSSSPCLGDQSFNPLKRLLNVLYRKARVLQCFGTGALFQVTSGNLQFLEVWDEVANRQVLRSLKRAEGRFEAFERTRQGRGLAYLARSLCQRSSILRPLADCFAQGDQLL